MNSIFQVIKIFRLRLFLTISFFVLLFFVFSAVRVKAEFADCGITPVAPFYQIKAPDGFVIAQIDSAGNMELNSASINLSTPPDGTSSDTFLIKNSFGIGRFAFNKASSNIAGTISSAQTQATLNSINGDDLVIKNSSGVIKARFDMATGNIYLSGQACYPVIPITSCEDLQKIGNDPAFPVTANFKLAPIASLNYGNNFIDCRATNPANPENNNSIWDYDVIGSYSYGDGTVSGAKGFKPILNFANIFDGKNYYIKNLFINRPTETNVGLFGTVGGNTEIKNIKFSNFNITGKDYVGGLVGRTIANKYYAKISNCVFDNSAGVNKVNGTGSYYVGGITGYWDRSGIYNSAFNGIVTGKSYVGGIAGYQVSYASGSIMYNISSCNSSGSVAGQGNYIGGLVGTIAYNSGFLNCIEYSKSSSSVLGVNQVGGLVGDLNISTGAAGIYKSSATGNVTGSGSNIGGLIGNANLSSNVSVAQESYATSEVKGNNFVGGVVGYVNGFTTIRLNYVYATGNITGSSYVGGLAGYAKADIQNSYSAGIVQGGAWTGGFVGSWQGSLITPSYWDIDVSGQANGCYQGCSNVYGLNTSKMVSGASPTNQTNFSGWNFNSYWKLDSIGKTGYYPCLSWQDNSTCVKAPLVISDCQQLQKIGNDPAYPLIGGAYLVAPNIAVNGGDFIDCSATNPSDPDNDGSPWDYDDPTSYGYGDGTIEGAKGFKPIGNFYARYKGDFDGANKEIRNLFIDYINLGTDFSVGVFGFSESSNFKNIILKNASVKNTPRNNSSDRNTGGLIGVLQNGTISNCYVSGNIECSNTYCYNTGGLIGYALQNVSISNSTSEANVIGNHAVGGLVGYHSNGDLINLSSKGKVKGNVATGGLIGYGTAGKIEYSYSTAEVVGIARTGGLMGECYKNISNSYYSGVVTGNNYVGGLVGYYYLSLMNNSYATGGVIGASYTGGVFGLYDDKGVLSNVYWNKEVSSQSSACGTGTCTGATDLTTAQMKVQSNYAGFDFTTPIWKIPTDYYACLNWQDVGTCVQ